MKNEVNGERDKGVEQERGEKIHVKLPGAVESVKELYDEGNGRV